MCFEEWIQIVFAPAIFYYFGSLLCRIELILILDLHYLLSRSYIALFYFLYVYIYLFLNTVLII